MCGRGAGGGGGVTSEGEIGVSNECAGMVGNGMFVGRGGCLATGLIRCD